ncbi:MAG: T9SS type A sorting domain-containing protein [Bacteroidetes bacterium]|jgi:hypothetical protein|nr:T9SS type A sorting domain-containing protein [Bacteroidota bacterium]
MKSLSLTAWIFLLLFPSLLSAQSVSEIFDDDPGSSVYRDASWGTAGAGDFLQLQGDKMPLVVTQHYSGLESGLIRYNHVLNGSWELYIAGNAWQTKDLSSFDSLVFYVNAPNSIPAAELPQIGFESANGNAKSPLISLSAYLTLDADSTTWQRVAIAFSAFQPFGNFDLAQFKTVRFKNGGVTSAIRTLWVDAIVAVGGTASDTLRPLTDQELLDTLQYTAFRYFWDEANPANGLVRDRSALTSPASIAATGFGLTALTIAVDHGWVTRAAAGDRVLTTLRTFWEKPQGAGASGTIGYKGWFYHFLDMTTATRLYTPSWKSELSSIDTGLLLAGIVDAQIYFDGADSVETLIRALADSVYRRIDWIWMTNGASSLTHGWSPEGGMLSYRWIGYNEAMVLYVLGLGAPRDPLPASAWTAWTSGYQWATREGYEHVPFPSLFIHQYSHAWIDFRGMADPYMRSKGITYFENSRRATLANRAYCIRNPGGYTDYGPNVWGLTACDGPTGYSARGGPSGFDDGTIAPTAAISSMPFTPVESIAAAREFYSRYGSALFGKYGFRDAFNPTVNWFGGEYVGIDQGPIIMMIENHRHATVWDRYNAHPAVARGLVAAGFQPVTSVASEPLGIPGRAWLAQNFPNPFNPETSFEFRTEAAGTVTLKVFDVLGRVVATVVDGSLPAGTFVYRWNSMHLSGGTYFYQLTTGGQVLTKKLTIVH